MNDRELRLWRELIATIRRIGDEIHAARKDHETADQSNHNQIIQPLPVKITAVPQLDPARQEYYESENRKQHSLWQRTKPWLEGTGVALAFALAVVNYRTFLEIQRQVSITQNQLEIADRPWISVRLSGVPESQPSLSFDDDGTGHLRVKVIMSNIGHSVANGVNVRIGADALGSGSFVGSGTPGSLLHAKQLQEKLCKPVPTVPSPTSLFTVFPGTESDVNYSIMFETQAITPIIGVTGKKITLIDPIVYGCVDYFHLAKAHQTGFIYLVRGPYALTTDMTISPNEVIFEQHFWPGEYAN